MHKLLHGSITIGGSDYDLRSVLGLLSMVIAYLLGPEASPYLPTAAVTHIGHAKVVLGVVGVLSMAQGKPLLREPAVPPKKEEDAG